MKIISIINNKGGVGKTTTTIHFGAFLASQQKKVLLIDLDGQCNLSARVGANGLNYDILNLLKKEYDSVRMKKDINVELYTLKGNKKIDLFNFKKNSLKEALKPLDKHFDYVIIDCPPKVLHEELLTSSEVALIASDFIIIPIQANEDAINGVQTLLDEVRRIKSKDNPNIEILGLLFTYVFEKEKLFKFFYDKVDSLTNGKVFKNYIKKNSEIQKAELYKQTIFSYNKNSSGATDYANFSIEALKRLK